MAYRFLFISLFLLVSSLSTPIDIFALDGDIVSCSSYSDSSCRGVASGSVCNNSSKSGTCQIKSGTTDDCGCVHTCDSSSTAECIGIKVNNSCSGISNSKCVSVGGASIDECQCDIQDPTPTPTGTPTPTLTPGVTISIKTSVTPMPRLPNLGSNNKKCTSISKNTIFPPNSECFANVVRVESDPASYPLSCIPKPEVAYTDKYSGLFPPKEVDVVVKTDIQDVSLGFLGPDSQTINKISSDSLAKQYLYNGLLDRPPFSKPGTPREAFRTFWRMISNQSQANIKAIFLKNHKSGGKSQSYYYLDSSGNKRETSTKNLYDSLPTSLKSVPVGNDYAKVYSELDKDLREKYDNLLPYDFNDDRSFVVIKDNISRENIPYLSAILSAIKGEKGLFNFYTPAWLVINPAPFGYAADEYSLDAKLIELAGNATCSKPKSTISQSSPKTFPINATLQQTVKVKVSSKQVDESPASCACSSGSCSTDYCTSYGDETACSAGGCDWQSSVKTYVLTGKAKGKDLTVFNNPKITSITKAVAGGGEEKVPSFFKMLTPHFSVLPDKAMVKAPGTKSTSDTPGGTITLGGDSLYRNNALPQDAMHILQNCWLMPKNSQSSSKCNPKTVKKGNVCPADCDNSIPDAGAAMAIRDTFSDIARRWLNTGSPLLDKFDTVVNSAVAAGVNPIFALTIWLNESNASNYAGVCERFGGGNPSSDYCTRLLDFGINLDDIASNHSAGEYHFQEQLDQFLNLPGYYKSVCAKEMAASGCPMLVYSAMFSAGTCNPEDGEGYLAGIMGVYEWLSPGSSFPCYPSAYP